MTHREPTQEQIKEFWEWCGFIQLPKGNKNYHYERTIKVMNWNAPDGSYTDYLPSLDLNNLFKYAVPKLRELRYYVVLRDISKGFHCSLVYTTVEKRSWYGESDDPALAVFWAIWEVIK